MIDDGPSAAELLVEMKSKRKPEPIQFPAPVSIEIADRIEATAEQIHAGNTHRTMLECRQLAEVLVDAYIGWVAEDVA